MVIKAVFFDIGGTLLTTTAILRKYMMEINKKHVKSLGYNFTEAEIDAARMKADEYILKKYKNPHCKDVIFPKIMFGFLGVKLDDKSSKELEEDFWKEIYSRVNFIKNANEVLIYIKPRGYKIVAITNNKKERAVMSLARFGLIKFFDDIITSEEFGLKSTTVPFRVAMERTGLKPEEVVMIGNHLFEDILPAKSLGIKTVLAKFEENFERVPKMDMGITESEIKADYVITDLIDIKGILEELNSG